MEFTGSTAVVSSALVLKDYISFMLSSIPTGFLLGCIPMVLGLGLSGIVKIFKNI